MGTPHRLIEAVREFVGTHDGLVTDVATTVRPNHQHPRPPGDGLLTCIRVDVVLRHGVFGASGPFLTEVFPRYRLLGAELQRHLRARGFDAIAGADTTAVTIVPYPRSDGPPGEPLAKLERPSRGSRTPAIAELARYSPYYREVAERYQVDYGVITTNGTVVGPDAGILATACAAAEAAQGPLSVVELGTGAGATVTALLGVGGLARYRGNDFSQELGAFFAAHVRPRARSLGVVAEVTVDSCERFALLDDEADLLIVGVYYEAQPDLVATRGTAIASCVKATGVVAIQSGKPENPWVTELLIDGDTPHRSWPWYDEAFCLRRLFPGVAVTTVKDETMVIAAQDASRVGAVIRRLERVPCGHAVGGEHAP